MSFIDHTTQVVYNGAVIEFTCPVSIHYLLMWICNQKLIWSLGFGELHLWQVGENNIQLCVQVWPRFLFLTLSW